MGPREALKNSIFPTNKRKNLKQGFKKKGPTVIKLGGKCVISLGQICRNIGANV